MVEHFSQKICFSYKKLYCVLMFITLPNIVFYGLSFYFHLERGLFNIDYLPSCLLFLFTHPIIKIIAVLLFLCAVIVDILLMIMQLYPFVDFGALFYLLGFILDGPRLYLFLTISLVIYCLLMPFILWKIAPQKSVIEGFLLILIVGFIGNEVTGPWGGLTAGTPTQNKVLNALYKVLDSRWRGFETYFSGQFFNALRVESRLYPGQQEYGAMLFQQPYAEKVLLIIHESFGAIKNSEVERDVLSSLYQNQNRYDIFEKGYFDFIGSTVQGQLRELCQLNVRGGYRLSRLEDDLFSDCMPNILKKQGYTTVALHGASGFLYDRYSWYPKAGFQKNLFTEHFLDKKRCHAFNGICDSELMDTVAQFFAQHSKIFVHWMTLTTHTPYSEKDIIDKNRFNCAMRQINNPMMCRYFALNAQFFDQLSDLLNRPEMAGVDVVIVGDHQPDLSGIDPDEILRLIKTQAVSYIHIKVKSH